MDVQVNAEKCLALSNVDIICVICSPRLLVRISLLECMWIPCFAVELGYMSVILLDIQPQIFLLDWNACKVSMFCTRWDGMHLDYLPSNMQLRFLRNLHMLYVFVLLTMGVPDPNFLYAIWLTDRNPPEAHNFEKHWPLPLPGHFLFLFSYFIWLEIINNYLGNPNNFLFILLRLPLKLLCLCSVPILVD